MARSWSSYRLAMWIAEEIRCSEIPIDLMALPREFGRVSRNRTTFQMPMEDGSEFRVTVARLKPPAKKEAGE